MQNLFEYYIESDNFHFKYAKGKPAVENQEYHNYNEIVFFIDGESFFISKNIQQPLVHNSIVIIPKEHFHQFCVSAPESYVRCILGFYADSEIKNVVGQTMDTIKVINIPNEKIFSVFKNLIYIVESSLNDEEKRIFIHSSLLQLLIYFKKYLSETVSSNNILSPIIIRTLNIIDEQYTENISIKNIAKQLYVSQSALAHKFSMEMNIPIYQYITKKRLAEAHKLIRQGEKLNNAARISGFNDYSTFYRLYKKYYK